jgi:GTP-binding protein
VILELKLLSDAAMVGLPNVGKSTLLRALSRARPEVGAYPFTTVEPQVGVVEVDLERIVLLEMPGVVERARLGVGIGIGFLRHAERTGVLVHVLDGAHPDPSADLEVVNEELRAFSDDLLVKPQLVVVNKVDLPEARGRREELERALAQKASAVLFISAATGEGLPELARAMALAVREAREREETMPSEGTVLRPAPSLRFAVRKVKGTFVVEGERPVALVEMMGIENAEARAEVLRRLKRMGVAAALRRAGVRPGHRVRFGEVEMEWEG